ncbi:MAG: nuclear transport factor 2 family protein [Janthinobacterium lividum]
MTKSNQEIVEELLSGASDKTVVERLMAEDSVYMSLTFDNAELKRLMPWAGIHKNGREGVLYTFRTLQTFWHIDDFTIKDIFSSGEDVAVFGSFTVHSKLLDKIFVSPFSVHAKVRDGQVTYLQYMEDTFGTGATFRSKGVWTFAGDPSGAEVRVGE